MTLITLYSGTYLSKKAWCSLCHYLSIPASSALPFHPTCCGLCYSQSKMQTNFMRLLLLLIIFLYLSYLFSASAIPATRTQNLKGEDDSSVLSSLTRLHHELGNGEEVVFDMKEEYIERRVDLETQDYEGTGANTDHDPKSPGGV
ncbi:hypothetical protein VNO78_16899 [Psophocarpus tetragonolobus]|uniref:Transmembrane protein n=1 Tax=Psophocarpus tetragonolobus TaxID=3891 RepID=A0AAN9XKX3_PSOTE